MRTSVALIVLTFRVHVRAVFFSECAAGEGFVCVYVCVCVCVYVCGAMRQSWCLRVGGSVVRSARIWNENCYVTRLQKGT